MNKQQKVTFALHVDMIGSTAETLVLSHQHGKVYASVTDTLYLLPYDGGLFWVSSEGIPLHPRSIRIKGSTPQIMAGTPYTIQKEVIVFRNGLDIDLSTRMPFPPEATIKNLLDLPDVFERVTRIYSSLALGSEKGFGTFIPLILNSIKHPSREEDGTPNDPILQYSWPLLLKVIHENLNQNLNGVLDAAKELLGLGPGLTPSGDDFLGGMFFVFHFLVNNYPGKLLFESKRIFEFIDRNEGKTNLISMTLLKDLADGQGSFPFRNFFNLLVQDGPIDVAVDSAMKLTKIGHSTGWDMLTGVLTGMLCTQPFSDEYANHLPSGSKTI